MSVQSEQVVFLIATILIALFAWIYLRDRQPRIGLWMLGWSAMYVHFTVVLLFSLSFLSLRWAVFLKTSALAVAGISFLLSVSAIYTDKRRRLVFVILTGAMSVIYTMGVVWDTRQIWIYPVLVFAASSVSLLHVLRYYGSHGRYLYVFGLAVVPQAVWSIQQSLLHNPAPGLFSFLSTFFIVSGLLYWRFYRRFTPGVVTTSISFIAWGGTFVMREFQNSPMLATSSVIWDLPQYFVAIGMILTLFENKAELATSIAHQYRSLFEEDLAAVYVSTFDGRFLDCNSAFVEMYGFSSKGQALSASAIACYADPAQREKFTEQLRGKGRVLNYESQQLRQNGKAFWILECATIVHNVDGEEMIEGSAIDITERKQMEIALRQSEERFVAVFRHSPMACAIISLTGEFLNVNENMLGLLKRSADDVIGKTGIDLGFWKSWDDNTPFLQKLHCEGSIQNLELEFRDAEGELHVVLYFGALVQAGEKQCIFGMFLDNTGQHELEAKFLQAQKMDALGRLAGSVAHDFNNLLGVISGYAELLEAKLGHDGRYGRYCSKVIEATQRSSGLTRQLLTFSRKEPSRTLVLDPNHALRELAGMLSRLIGEDIEIKIDLRSRGSIVIDRTHFEQIIVNLAVNARDAMPHGGQIVIETDNQTGPAPADLPCLVIRLRDTGEGMDEGTKLHAFEPFFTTKPVGRGTGLGLATVYGIIKECAGEISIESSPGKGTQVSILLPLALQTDDVNNSSEGISVRKEGGNILLVEDELEFLHNNAQLLRSIGYSVRCAGSGQEALELVPEIPQLDLVITDVVMPEMNGREFADRLLQIRPHTKVLFVSGYADEVLLQAGVSTLSTPFLPKPFSLRQLDFKVQELLTV
ncbi:MAG TPA: PAS domain S-box protein [Candidatus Angelobacter sp.]|jgi:PAS domain S-box-containing protein|nr:PAS domain S-box protein [Candidatus Angelobacter sp.]